MKEVDKEPHEDQVRYPRGPQEGKMGPLLRAESQSHLARAGKEQGFVKLAGALP